MDTCRICEAGLEARSWTVRELFFGTRDPFTYRACTGCGCLQLVDPPEDAGPYYPDDYYARRPPRRRPPHPLLDALTTLRLRLALAGGPAARLLPGPRLPDWIRWAGATADSLILDLGCGGGNKLVRLRAKGFRHLEGTDPFNPETLHLPGPITIHRLQAWELADRQPGTYDLVMMHHSLEHIPDQSRALTAAHDLLRPGGVLLVRIPLCSSWAWEHYRECWVQLDAPRHLFLHSRRSMELLGGKTGFTLQGIHYDSTAFQFTGSERYRRDIPLTAEDAPVDPEVLAGWEERARQLNREERGDQAAFVFRRPE